MSWHDELGELIEKEGFGFNTVHSKKNSVFDYKQLLKKYIEHIGIQEGIFYLGDNYVGDYFTIEELAELRKISGE